MLKCPSGIVKILVDHRIFTKSSSFGIKDWTIIGIKLKVNRFSVITLCFFWNMNFGVAIRYVTENNKTIKTVHRKELMKVIEFKKSGTSPEEIYKLKMA